MLPRSLLLLVALGPLSAGCARDVALKGSAKEPSVLMNYNGVRAGGRRFPDYGVVDRSILARPR